MSDIYHLIQGEGPLIVSMPHSGLAFGDTADSLSEAARLKADTDWHIPELYNFLSDMDVTIIMAKHSRYVIDLNRDPSGISLYPGQNVTELCPRTTFENQPIYKKGREPDEVEIQRRVRTYWQPYHGAIIAEIERAKARYGQALLWDAHSIRSQVPRFFKGTLTDINIGTADGRTCSLARTQAVETAAKEYKHYSVVTNGRFKGGYITRHYGKDKDVNALQLELSQATYMLEKEPFQYEQEKAQLIQPVLQAMVQAFKNDLCVNSGLKIRGAYETF